MTPIPKRWIRRYTYICTKLILVSVGLLIRAFHVLLFSSTKDCHLLFLFFRALDTVEDDMSISAEVKVPILLDFHHHIYDPDWRFACGRGTRYEILMDQFHHISSAFLGLGSSYQEVITDITKRMGEGMAKFISKEIETLDDYDEYCHYVSGLVVIGLSKIFHDNGKENLVPESLSNSLGLFMQKANIIRDYLEERNQCHACFGLARFGVNMPINLRKSCKSYIIGSKSNYSLTLIFVLFIVLGIICAYLSSNRPESFRFLTSLKPFEREADKHNQAT